MHYHGVVISNDGKNRVQDIQDREVGKLAVAYSWWARARMNSIHESEFDEYMAAHLHFIDAMIEDDEGEITQALNRIKPWERYAG